MQHVLELKTLQSQDDTNKRSLELVQPILTEKMIRLVESEWFKAIYIDLYKMAPSSGEEQKEETRVCVPC